MLLVNLVRVQNLSERISQLYMKETMGDESINRTAYLSAFQAELDKFRASLPKSLLCNSEFLPTQISSCLFLVLLN